MLNCSATCLVWRTLDRQPAECYLADFSPISVCADISNIRAKHGVSQKDDNHVWPNMLLCRARLSREQRWQLPRAFIKGAPLRWNLIVSNEMVAWKSLWFRSDTRIHLYIIFLPISLQVWQSASFSNRYWTAY